MAFNYDLSTNVGKIRAIIVKGQLPHHTADTQANAGRFAADDLRAGPYTDADAVGFLPVEVVERAQRIHPIAPRLRQQPHGEARTKTGDQGIEHGMIHARPHIFTLPATIPLTRYCRASR